MIIECSRIRVYFAAPLFNPMERAFNEEMARSLEEVANVFLPQRDGALLTKLVAEGQSVDIARRQIFSCDIAAIENCHAVIAVLDGRTIDEGVAFEVGYAHALGKVCIAYKSDDRTMLPTGDNPMIAMACEYYCSNLDTLVNAVSTIASSVSPENCGLTERVLEDRANSVKLIIGDVPRIGSHG